MAEKSDGSTASYYILPPDCEQLQDLISHRDMNAQIGEIFRACYRYGIASHSDKLRDAKKMKFYAEAEIARLEKLEEKEPGGFCSHGYSPWTACPKCSPVGKTVHNTYCDVCKVPMTNGSTLCANCDIS